MTAQRNIGIIRIILFLVNFITIIFWGIIYRSTKLIIWDFMPELFKHTVYTCYSLEGFTYSILLLCFFPLVLN